MKVLRRIVDATLSLRSKELVANDYPFVGLGLDAFEWKYGTPPNRMKLVDIDKINNKQKIPLSGPETTVTHMPSHAEFMESFAVEAGLGMKFPDFSASINTKFSKTSRENGHVWFSHRSTKVTGNLSSLGEDKIVLQQALLPSVRDALDGSVSPSEIFEAYGTHVVVKAYEGGMAEYFCSSQESGSLTKTDFEIAAKAGYKSVGGSISSSVKLTAEEQELLTEISGHLSLTIHGGEHFLAQCLGQAGRSDCPGTGQSAWDDWAESTKDAPAFIGIAKDGLMPIWKLANKQARMDEIEMAFKLKVAESFTPEVFSATSAVAHAPEAKASLPPNYKMLSGGASLTYPEGDPGVLMTDSFPESDSKWIARAKDHMASSNGMITAYVIGIYDPLNNWDVMIARKSSYAQHPNVAVDVPDGYVSVGGGARVDYGSGPGNLLTASYPAGGKTFEAASKDHVSPNPAELTTFAIGLKSTRPEITITQCMQTRTSPHAHHPSVDVTLPQECRMTGGGAKVNLNGGFGNMLTGSYPSGDQVWAASSKDHIHPNPTTINAFAIGVQVVASSTKKLQLDGANTQE